MLDLAGVTATSLLLRTLGRGAWIGELELDLTGDQAMPSGRVALHIADLTLSGTVDPDGSGTFGARHVARVIAGANGWNKTAPRRDFHNDANVTAASVISATASEVGETVSESPSTPLGADYVRQEDTAGMVLAGLDWYVDTDGNTHIATRPTSAAPSDVEILDYDPLRRVLEVGCSTTVVLPGMTFTDQARFDGEIVARDVEQRFTADGHSKATVWCAAASSSASFLPWLDRYIETQVDLPFLRSYPYRIQEQGSDGRLTLQAITKTPGLPDLILVSVWPGVPGATATYPMTGVVVRIAFMPDRAHPIVVGFDPGNTPDTLTLSVLSALNIGGAGAVPLAKASAIADLQAAITGWTPVSNDGGAALKLALATWLAGVYATVKAKGL